MLKLLETIDLGNFIMEIALKKRQQYILKIEKIFSISTVLKINSKEDISCQK